MVLRTKVGGLMLLLGALGFLGVAEACNKGPDLDHVPTGTPVSVTRHDGGVMTGSVESVSKASLVMRVGDRVRTVPREDIEDVRVNEPEVPAKALTPKAKFHEYIVPSGTQIAVKVLTSVTSASSTAESRVSAELAQDVMIGRVNVLPAGSPVDAVVSSAEPSGKVKGLAHLSLHFEGIRAEGEQYPFSADYARTAESTKGQDAAKIAAPAAGGAIIGALIGGKKGALIGGAIGGGAGTGVVLATSGKEVVVPAGTVLHLTLDRDLTVRMPIKTAGH